MLIGTLHLFGFGQIGSLAGGVYLLVGSVPLLALLAVGLEVARMGPRARFRIFSAPDLLPKQNVALVLGCVPVLSNGRTNQYFFYRMQAAAELYHAGKVAYLLVSGDPKRNGHDEPQAMRTALVALSVPESRVIVDAAGFRTFQSVLRAREVFGQQQLIVISQRFHNERALYLMDALGLDGVGYSAKDPTETQRATSLVRETLARFRAVFDVRILRKRPPTLGQSDRFFDHQP